MGETFLYTVFAFVTCGLSIALGYERRDAIAHGRMFLLIALGFWEFLAYLLIPYFSLWAYSHLAKKGKAVRRLR